MLPLLKPGQLVVASGMYHQLELESVVVIRHDNLDKIKRIRQVQADRIFVVGDNPKASLDSRSFGWLPISTVVGKVLWPRL